MSTTSTSKRSVVLRNGRTREGKLISVRIEESRIAALNAHARPGDLHIDLGADRVLPGLINAHDHLQLNCLPRLKFRPEYHNVTEWIADIKPRLRSDPLLLANSAIAREDRLLIGGVKNLLSGVTTVAHHDPLYPVLRSDVFPVRVLANYGWAHSLSLDGEESVSRAYRATPPNWPWIVHAAEGVDAAAAGEFDRLRDQGCIASNTIVVHGVGFTAKQFRQLDQAGAGLIWCPASNLHLFGTTLGREQIRERCRLALGSDSRLSGASDLLSELRLAQEITGLDEPFLESLVTERAAELLRATDRGVLAKGSLADILVVPGDLPLARISRAHVRMVLIGGELRYADPDYAAAFAQVADCAPVRVDGRNKFLSRLLVSQLRSSGVSEQGLELDLAASWSTNEHEATTHTAD